MPYKCTEQPLETCEPSRVLEAASPFFISVAHSPLGTVGYVTAPELTLSERQCSELRDTWQRRSSPQQGGEVRERETRGDAEPHMEV
jgi:hypothetical protein